MNVATAPDRLEQQANEHEQRLGQALRASKLYVWSCDHRLRQWDAEADLCQMFGLDPTRCRRPGPWRRQLHPDDRQRVEQAFREALRQGQSLDVSFRICIGGSAQHWFNVRGMMVGSDGHNSLSGVCADITERKRVEQRSGDHVAEQQAISLARAQTAREQAEAAAAARDQFLAVVSHELRSPLAAIQNWSHVLEHQLQGKASLQHRAVAGIRTGVEQQVRLIDDLLDATRIMTGKLGLSRASVPLRPVVEAALASVQAAAQRKHIHLGSELRLIDERVDGDPDRLQQIVWNLLNNAIKFTPDHGHVWLTLERHGSHYRLEIGDDGRGIAAALLPQLFERFRSEDTTGHRGQRGLGLGLVIVRHLVDLHAGSVSARSAGLGLGACFTVLLPAPDILFETRQPVLPC